MIEFRNVSFSYGDKPVLENLSFNIPAGESRVIMGQSGSGKSTILRLILGLVKLDEGNILIEGIKDIVGVEEVVPIGEYRISRGGRGFGGMMSHMMRSGGGATLTFTGIFPEDQDYLIGEQIIAEEGRKLDDSDDGEFIVLLGYSAAEAQFLTI